MNIVKYSRAAGLAALTAASLSGCDNIEWGGIQVDVQAPVAEGADTGAAQLDTVAAVPPLVLPSGPVLFHVKRLDAAGAATIEPVAELRLGELHALGPRLADRAAEYATEFSALYYRRDQPYTLFRGAARVGTFYVRAPLEAGTGACPRLGAAGHVELRPDADTLSEFLAWPPGVRGGDAGRQTPQFRSAMASMAQVLVRRGVSDGGLAGDWRLRAPDDLRALDVGVGSLGFAATFVVRDSLAQGSPSDSAGAAFIVADYEPSRGYFPLYFDAAWYGPGQKRALRWLDAADLFGDASAEWLLRAHGDASSWYEIVGQRDAARTVLWSSRRPVCEVRESEGISSKEQGMMNDEVA